MASTVRAMMIMMTMASLLLGVCHAAADEESGRMLRDGSSLARELQTYYSSWYFSPTWLIYTGVSILLGLILMCVMVSSLQAKERTLPMEMRRIDSGTIAAWVLITICFGLIGSAIMSCIMSSSVESSVNMYAFNGQTPQNVMINGVQPQGKVQVQAVYQQNVPVATPARTM